MDLGTTRIIKAARELLKEYGYFMDELWHVDDVNFICEQKNLDKLSKEEAMCVFDIAKEQFDGEYGISWPQLERALNIYFRKQKAMKQVSVEEQ